MEEETAFRSTVSDLITCTICLEPCKKPTSLPCLHTYCLVCLTQFIESSKTKRSSNSFSFKCPTCMRIIELPEGGVSTFQNNFLVENLNEMLTRKHQEMNKTCDVCTQRVAVPQKIEFHCIDCRKSMCASCNAAHSAFTQDHSVSNITSLTKAEVEKTIAKDSEMCTEHITEIRKFFCIRCQVPVCRDCRLNKHYNHECSSIHGVAEQSKKNILSNLDSIESLLEESESELCNVRKKKQSAINQREKLKTHLQNYKQMILNSVSQSIDKLETEIYIHTRKTFHRIEGKMNIVQGNIEELTKVRDIGSNTLQDGRHSQTIQADKHIKATLEKIRKHSTHLKEAEQSDLRIIFQPEQIASSPFGTLITFPFKEDSDTGNTVVANRFKYGKHVPQSFVKPSKFRKLPCIVTNISILSPWSIAVGLDQSIFITTVSWGRHELFIYSPEGVLKCKSEYPNSTLTWQPMGGCFSSTNLIVCNRANKQEGGGLYVMGQEFKRIVICDYPKDVTVTGRGDIVYISGGVSAKSGFLCFPSTRVPLIDPRFICYNHVTSEVIVSHRNGVSAFNDKFQNTWEFKGETNDKKADNHLTPTGVCVSANGLVFLADTSRICILSRDGKFQQAIPTSPGGIMKPFGLAFNDKGHLLVSSYEEHRVSVLKISE